MVAILALTRVVGGARCSHSVAEVTWHGASDRAMCRIGSELEVRRRVKAQLAELGGKQLGWQPVRERMKRSQGGPSGFRPKPHF